VLYGTGNGAEKLIHHLDSFGITLSGIFVSDDFVRNRSFCGHKVESFAALQERLGEVTVVLGFATDRPELLESIKELSRRVNGRLYVPEVPVFGNDIFTPRLLAEKSEDIRRLYEALADDRSRRVLEGLIRFKISGDPQELYAIETDRREAYEYIIKPQSGCVFVDAGAYDGDTALEFIEYCPDFGRIYAIEPAPVNFRKLSDVPGLKGENILLYNCAVGDSRGEMRFSGKGGRSPYITEKGKISVKVDTLCNLVPEAPDVIKLDVEGAEREALQGGAALIERYAPSLMISVYHRTEDFIDIPLKVMAMQKGYRLYLRHHPYLPAWETNLYAVKR